MKLLVCIAFHYSPERLKYLTRVLHAFLNEYKVPVHIIIDTNTAVNLEEFSSYDNIEVYSHGYLKHPFHLTQCHRQHIKDNIDKFDHFAYFEDDMYLPFENYISYLEKFKKMFPRYIPSFVRIEKANGEEFVSDVPEHHKIEEIINIEGRQFISFKFPHHYHAFWILPQKELKETLTKDFERLHDSREIAASYPMWELNKKPLIEIYNKDGKYLIKEDCYSYHLPSNYALGDGPNGKIRPEEIFI